jgi:general secretion pathway protein D
MFRLNYADAETVTEVLRGVLGQGRAPSNPVARAWARAPIRSRG